MQALLQTRGCRARRLASALAFVFLAASGPASGSVGDPSEVAAADVYRESIPTSRGNVVVEPATRGGPVTRGVARPVDPTARPPKGTPGRPAVVRESDRRGSASAVEATAHAGRSSPLLPLAAFLALSSAAAVAVAVRGFRQ